MPYKIIIFTLKFENTMSLKNKIARSDAFWSTPIKIVFYRLANKYYEVNKIIKSTQINDDKSVFVELINGIKLECPPSQNKAEINFTERYKYGNKSKMDKILDVSKYYFMYEILSELYFHNEYFKYFDIKPADIVIDAGANIGGFAIQAAIKAGPAGKVFAIEPDEQNIETLKRNIAHNKLENITIVPLALWSEQCTKEFHISRRPGEHSLLSYDNELFSKGRTRAIQCDTLDNIFRDFKRVNYLKMDIEGAEIEALKGAKNLLSKLSPNLLIEALHEVNGSPAYKTLVPYLQKLGYSLMREVDGMRGTIIARKSILK